jgi:hypothetical protein
VEKKNYARRDCIVDENEIVGRVGRRGEKVVICKRSLHLFPAVRDCASSSSVSLTLYLGECLIFTLRRHRIELYCRQFPAEQDTLQN